MIPLKLELPDALAKRASDAGLLAPEALEAMLRDRLRQRSSADSSRTERDPSQRDGRAAWLAEALAELRDLDADIEEDDLPPIGQQVRVEARRVLRGLRGQGIAPVVYPTEDAEISLYFQPPGVPASLQVLLDSGGGATWSAVVPGHQSNGRCERASELPLGLLRRSLSALTESLEST